MPAIKVHSSRDIAASPDEIMSALQDFHTWPAWSPWLYTEPEATVTYQGNAGEVGHGYEWTGNKVGAGSMSLLSRNERSMRCHLTFLKPFKSQADVGFELDAKSPDKTTVTWMMDSQLPFFMLFFKATMIGMIRSDYERGLLMLKDYVEKGAVPSKVFIEDVVDSEAMHYVGYHGEAFMGQLSEAMGERFRALTAATEAASIDIAGPPLCFYDHMDFKQGKCNFTVALPTAQEQSLPDPMVTRQRPACKALKLVHHGAYRHLGSGWATIMGEARARKLKVNKQISPFENYLNDPDRTDEENLVTEIYLPLR